MTNSAAMRETRIGPDAWQPAVADASGPQIVVGGPGTGKTEFLVRRAVHLIESGTTDAREIMVLSFGRRGTADLDRRIRAALTRSTPRLDVATFHSLAARIVERQASEAGWARPPQLLTGPEQVDLVQRLLSGEDRAAWSPPFRGLLGSPTLAAEVTDFILRAREQLLTDDELEQRAAGRGEWTGLPAFVARYDAALRHRGRVDYGTLLASAVRLLEAAGEPARITGPLSHVLVDEYQDTTTAQARLLGALLPRGGNLTVAADPYQSIYSFRGADLRNVERFPDQFPADDGKPGRRLVLTASFRTPAAILGAAERVAGGELPGSAGPVIPAATEGRVESRTFSQETEEAEWIADEMQRMHLEEGLPYAAMGVFVRTRRRLVPDLVRALHRRGMPHEAPDARLTERAPARFVFDLVAAATGVDGPAETARAVRRLLLGPMYRLRLESLRRVERARLADPERSWPAAVRAAAPEAAELAQLLDDDSWATDRPAASGLWHVWSSLDAVRPVVSDPVRSEERAGWSSLGQVLRRWNERNPAASLADYRRLAEDEDFEATPLLSYRRPQHDVPTITSLHQCKGLEFEVVFIADAVETVFPDLRSRDSLLGVRHLLDHLPADPSEYRAFRLQEERRLAYTAMSRARRRVVWTATVAGLELGRGRPSRFLSLVRGDAADSDAVDDLERAPVTAREAEGVLRRTLADPAQPAARRLAALSVLTADQSPLRPAEAWAGFRTRGGDTGLIGDDHTLSPSQAESYDTCPRRYALERRLHIGASSSVYLEFGSMIHDVLEAVEQAAIDEGRPRGSLSDALAKWETVFDPAAFGGTPFSDAWHARGVQALTHLYEHWPGSGEAFAVEHTLQMDLGGRRWTGRADRVERHDRGAAIVDYKTSRNPPRIADVEESMQLGFYLLAAAEDERLADAGTPYRAEMWFPAAGGKSVKTRSLQPGNIDRIRDKLEAAGEGIIAEEWHPRPGSHCDRCPLRVVCPAWLEGSEAFV